MELTITACRILSLARLVRSILRDGMRTRSVESLPLESERYSFWNKDRRETQRRSSTHGYRILTGHSFDWTEKHWLLLDFEIPRLSLFHREIGARLT